MNGRMDRNRKIFASIFLLGYLSFVLLSITHFHSFAAAGSGKTVLEASTSAARIIVDSGDDCPICHLYSSVSFSPLNEVISADLTVKSRIITTGEAGFQAKFLRTLSLRAPPSLI